jgi:hypothetical protein
MQSPRWLRITHKAIGSALTDFKDSTDIGNGGFQAQNVDNRSWRAVEAANANLNDVILVEPGGNCIDKR